MSHRLELQVLAGEFAVCRLPSAAEVPAWADGPFVSLTRTAEELSVVCAAGAVPGGVRAEKGWRLLRVAGTLDFGMVGVLASLAAPLAEAGVSLLCVSTFGTDYLLVRGSDLGRAVAALGLAGHRVAPGPG